MTLTAKLHVVHVAAHTNFRILWLKEARAASRVAEKRPVESAVHQMDSILVGTGRKRNRNPQSRGLRRIFHKISLELLSPSPELPAPAIEVPVVRVIKGVAAAIVTENFRDHIPSDLFHEQPA